MKQQLSILFFFSYEELKNLNLSSPKSGHEEWPTLHDLARAMNLVGFSSLNKAELVAQIYLQEQELLEIEASGYKVIADPSTYSLDQLWEEILTCREQMVFRLSRSAADTGVYSTGDFERLRRISQGNRAGIMSAPEILADLGLDDETDDLHPVDDGFADSRQIAGYVSAALSQDNLDPLAMSGAFEKISRDDTPIPGTPQLASETEPAFEDEEDRTDEIEISQEVLDSDAEQPAPEEPAIGAYVELVPPAQQHYEFFEQSAVVDGYRLDFSVVSETGYTWDEVMAAPVHKKKNQDAHSVRVLDNAVVLVICDGMGGHEAGEIVSRIAADTFVDSFTQNYPPSPTWPMEVVMREAAHAAHQDVCFFAANNGLIGNTGTTLVAAVFTAGKAYIVNVGDSRGYQVFGGAIDQITTDHDNRYHLVHNIGLPEEQIEDELRSGKRTLESLTPLSMFLGLEIEDLFNPDVFTVDFGDDDQFVLCSDGLIKQLDDQELNGLLSSGVDAEELLCEVRERGEWDDVTYCIVRVKELTPVRMDTDPNLPVVTPPPVQQASLQPQQHVMTQQLPAETSPAEVQPDQPTSREWVWAAGAALLAALLPILIWLL